MHHSSLCIYTFLCLKTHIWIYVGGALKKILVFRIKKKHANVARSNKCPIDILFYGNYIYNSASEITYNGWNKV